MKKSSDPRGDIHKYGILKFISHNPSMRIRSKVKEIVRHTRLSRSVVTEHLNKLVADNKIVKTGRGEYAPRKLSYQCIEPYTIPILSESAFKRVCWYLEFERARDVYNSNIF